MLALSDLRSELATRMVEFRSVARLLMANWLRAVPFVLLAMIVGRVAWLGTLNEDAFISYRCLENLMHGLGMTWLYDMRSQPYTHPLWMLLHIPLRLVIPDVKIVGFLISFACLGGVLWCLHQRYGGWRPGYSLVVLTPLLLSKCFTEYSTSGLENPLAHLAAVLFFVGFLGPQGASFSMDQAAFLAAVAFLNRQDHALFYAIPIAVLWFQRRQYLADLKSLAIAALPVAAWFAFAVFYYGSALPDTYYAKLNAGIDKDLLAVQGLTCVAGFLEADTASFLVIVAALVSAVVVIKTPSLSDVTRQRFAAAAASLALFLAYVVYAGGDYMLGRFFSTPFIIAVVLLAESLLILRDVGLSSSAVKADAPRASVGARESLLGLGFAAAFLVSLCLPDFALGKKTRPTRWKFCNLDMQSHPWNYRLLSGFGVEAGDWVYAGGKLARKALAAPEGETFVEQQGAAGGACYYAGPSYGVIDPYGLVDPLLCRLPCQSYNAGHFYRVLPEGYEQARRLGDTSGLHPALREYYERTKFVKTGPLLEPNRIGAAITYASGGEQQLINKYVSAMSDDARHKNDFWMSHADRGGRLEQLSSDDERHFRGPIVAGYARLLSGMPEGEKK